MLRALKESYWQLRKEPHLWLEILGQHVSPRLRQRLKYGSELGYWEQELVNLDRWWRRREMDWWGVPPPDGPPPATGGEGEGWKVAAILGLHARYPCMLEELAIGPGDCAGRRVLEVGCGPLVPILQLPDCERHGLDPLMDAYAAAGWPVGALDARLLRGFGEAMPYPDAEFDVVVCRNALDHVDDVARVAAEMIRVLRPGGRLLLAVEYHPPTREEPVQLDDDAMVALFAGASLRKLRDRSKAELHADLAARFGLSLDALNRRSNPAGPNRLTAWHGVKPG